MATPSITPGDAIGGVGSNDASRTRDARSTGGAGKRHVHHSPRRISESHWAWGRILTALRRERGAGHESPRGLRRRTSWWTRCGVNRQGTGRGGVKRVGVLASRLPGWFHDSAATPCFGADFFPFFATSPFWFSLAAKRLAIDGTEAHHDKYDKYANTPKSAVEAPHSGSEIGGSFTFRDSASFLRFSHHVRIRLRRPKSAAHDCPNILSTSAFGQHRGTFLEL